MTVPLGLILLALPGLVDIFGEVFGAGLLLRIPSLDMLAFGSSPRGEVRGLGLDAQLTPASCLPEAVLEPELLPRPELQRDCVPAAASAAPINVEPDVEVIDVFRFLLGLDKPEAI
jgi:hypothetical protein